jgi:hypothetical protein
MLLYFNIILTLIFGLIIGLNLKRVPYFTSFRKVSPELPINLRFDQDHSLNKKHHKQDSNHCFDILEVRFLHKLLEHEGNEVDVKTLNLITNLTGLTAENQRQRRHLFLKELNLKLFLIFGTRESIVRLDSLEDKRVKKYVLSEEIDREKLMVAISVQVA